MLKTKLIGLKPEIFAENTAWIWSQLKLHLRMISSKNSSKEVRHDFYTTGSVATTRSLDLGIIVVVVVVVNIAFFVVLPTFQLFLQSTGSSGSL